MRVVAIISRAVWIVAKRLVRLRSDADMQRVPGTRLLACNIGKFEYKDCSSLNKPTDIGVGNPTLGTSQIWCGIVLVARGQAMLPWKTPITGLSMVDRCRTEPTGIQVLGFTVSTSAHLGG